jgi:hypothetical protein
MMCVIPNGKETTVSTRLGKSDGFSHVGFVYVYFLVRPPQAETLTFPLIP